MTRSRSSSSASNPAEILWPTTPSITTVTLVGLTSEEFGRTLGRALGSRHQATWPRRISGLHVELVDTVAGDGSAGRAHGLGGSGLWLRVRVFGLGVLRFGNDEDPEGRLTVLDEYYQFRRHLVDALERDLLGPGSPDEVITDPPTTKYIAGVLFPRDSDRIDPAQDLGEDRGLRR